MIRAPKLTAAVCTHGRPDALSRALRSLAEQSAAIEILVVENGVATAETRDTAERCGAQYVNEPEPGLDRARNRALRTARTELVAFLDDDAVADRGWAAALAAAFEDAHVALCTGRVEALETESPGARLFEANGGFARGVHRIQLPHDAGTRLHGLPAPLIAWAVSIGSGCSMAVRREIALAIGGFDPNLDRGAALPGGGDLDMIWRLLRYGHDVVYEPTALAHHEHRKDEEAARAQIAGHQRGLVAFLTKAVRESVGVERAGVTAFLAWRLIKPGVRLARRAIGRDPLPASALLRMWRACWSGLNAYGPIETKRPAMVERWNPASSS